jgi:hypothetical protein
MIAILDYDPSMPAANDVIDKKKMNFKKDVMLAVEEIKCILYNSSETEGFTTCLSNNEKNQKSKMKNDYYPKLSHILCPKISHI